MTASRQLQLSANRGIGVERHQAEPGDDFQRQTKRRQARALEILKQAKALLAILAMERAAIFPAAETVERVERGAKRRRRGAGQLVDEALGKIGQRARRGSDGGERRR